MKIDCSDIESTRTRLPHQKKGTYVMKVTEKPKSINALYFDGSWENGIEIVKTLNEIEICPFSLMNYGTNENYISRGSLAYGRNNWFIYPIYESSSGSSIKVMTDEKFKEKFVEA